MTQPEFKKTRVVFRYLLNYQPDLPRKQFKSFQSSIPGYVLTTIMFKNSSNQEHNEMQDVITGLNYSLKTLYIK